MAAAALKLCHRCQSYGVSLQTAKRSLYIVSSRTITSAPPSPEYDVVFVGGGIVGAAAAREVQMRHPNLKMALLEKEKVLAKHQSGHNSGVIHCGIYYTPGSLKAKLCVEGLDLMYKYLDEKNIPYKKVGKLIVAVDDIDLPRLDTLWKRGHKNKVRDLQMVEGKDIKQFEPNCLGLKAIHSPHTGIVDYSEVNRSYGRDFEAMGGEIHTDFKVTGFRLAAESQQGSKELGNKYPVEIVGQDGSKIVRCRYAMTCAGLYSDILAEMTGCAREPRIVPFRGEYLLLHPEKANLVKGNIYPVPDPRFPFLGVHFTPRMDGEMWLGPNAILAFKREGYTWFDFHMGEFVDAVKFRGFQRLALKYVGFGTKEMIRSWFIGLQLKQLQRYIPQITRKDILRGPAGVRAQAMDAKGNLVDDFVFDSGETDLAKRVLHCRNAPSPGATSSLSIAKMIADRVQKHFKF